MAIITKEVTTKWNNMNKELFLAKGYEFTGYRDDVIVKVSDLSRGSSIKVETECDWCKKKLQTSYKSYNDTMETFGNYLCLSCRKKEEEIISKNVLHYTHPHLAKLLKNKDGYYRRLYNVQFKNNK